MADRSDDPIDNARMDRLNRELAAVEGKLERDIAEAKKVQGEQTRSGAREERTAAKNEATSRRNEQTERQAKERARYDRERSARLQARRREGGTYGGELVLADRPGAGQLARDVSPGDRIRASGERVKEAIRQQTLRAEQVAYTEFANALSAGAAQAVASGATPPGARQRPDLRRQLEQRLGPSGGGGLNLQDAAIQSQLGDRYELYQRARAAAGAESQYDDALQRSTRTMNLSSDAMRRHGALTTEFISAAAKGQVTVRELGFQVGATVAKFAGWTAAATAVYGALAAVNQLGSGAIQSLNGVALLDRVVQGLDTQAAQREFRALAEEFNLPIDQVADAAYGMAKIFRDQDQIFKSTQQTLFAVKVGELDTVTATRYLTAIVNGFKLSAEDLPGIFDSINQAQNRFGGNTGQLIEGVAKAGGQFRAAGGDVQFLIALLETGVKLTGRTGSEIGTAIQRSAEIVQRPNRRQSIISLLGVDPRDSSIEDIYQAAFERARTASKEEVNKIATEIATPQLATRIVPILQNEKLFRQIFTEIDPNGAAQGSAQRELDKALRAPTEKLKALGVDLQRLGSSLAQSGLLAPMVAFVELLDKALELAIFLTDQFGQFPGSLRLAASFMVQIAAATALARRFDVGGQIAGAPGFLARSSRGRTRAEILSGLDTEVGFLNNERRGFATRQTQHALELNVLEEQRRRLAAGEQTAESARRLADNEEQIAVTKNRMEAEERRQVFAAERNAQVQAARRDIARRTGVFGGRQDPDAVAREHGVNYYGTTEPPSQTQPRRIGEDAGRAADTAVVGGGQRDARRAAESGRRANQSLAKSYREAAAASTRAEAAAIVAGTAFTNAAGAVGRAGRGLGRAGAELLGAIGPLGIVAAGAIAIPTIYAARKKALERQQQQAEDLAAIPTNQRQADLLRKRAEETLADGGFTNQNFNQALKALTYLDSVKKLQAKQRARGQVVTGLYGPEIDKMVAEDAKALQDGRITPEEYERRMRQRLKEITQSQQDPAHRARQAQLAKGRMLQGAGPSGYYDALIGTAGLDEQAGDLLDAQAKALAQMLGVRFSGRGAERLGANRLVRAASLRRDNTDEGRAAYAEARAGLQAIDDAAKKEMDRSLTFARSQEERDTAYRNYYRAIGAPVRGAARARDRLVDRRDALRDQVDRLEAQGGDRRRTPDSAARTQLGARRRDLEGLNQDLKDLDAETGNRRREQRLLRRVAQVQRYQEDSQLRSAQTTVGQYGVQAGAQRARYLLTRIGEERTEAIRVFGRESREVLELTGQYRAQAEAVAQEQLREIQARSGLREAQQATPGGQGRERLRGLQQQLAFMRAHGKQYGPADIIGIQQQIAQTTRELAQQAAQDAQDLINAQLELDVSRTEDPIRQAQLRLNAAKQLRRYADTPAEKLRAQAEENNARRTLRQTKQQEAYERLQFEYDIGKIDRDALVSRLQILLGTIKGNRDLRRQIERQIASLKKDSESEYELNVGNIRLPTVYEVARTLQGKSNVGSTVINRNTLNVNVTGPQDYDELGRVLEEHVSGAGKAAARAAGMR